MAERPALYDDLHWVWEAFFALSPSRPVGMDLGAIPLSEIVVYLDLRDIGEPEARQDFMRLIRAMDGEFLEQRRAKA